MNDLQTDRSKWTNVYPVNQPKLVLGKIHDTASAGLPPWAYGFDLQREADGRLFAVGLINDCYVFVQPKRWKDIPMNQDMTANFGVNMQSLQGQMNGTLQTNDPNFSPIITAASSQAAGEPEGRHSAQTDYSVYFVPVALVIVAIAIVWTKLRKK